MYKPLGVGPLKVSWLQNSVDANRDGWGIAVRTQDGRIIVQRGFDDKAFIEFGSSFGADVEVVAHARIATSGLKNEENLHPFAIYSAPDALQNNPDEEPVAYLFHNGIVSVGKWDKTKSDTWHLARIWEAGYGDSLRAKLRLRGWRRRQKKRLSEYNKFVLMDPDGVSIINPNAGKWVEGVWHSNSSALFAPSPYHWETWEGWEPANGSRQRIVSSTGSNTGSYEAFGEDDLSDEALLRNLELQCEETVLSDKDRLHRGFLLDQWEKYPTVDEIEESLYCVDAKTAAVAIHTMLVARGFASRLGDSE